jgi:CRP/FNR family nitrogen fixation transcriptional regulator
MLDQIETARIKTQPTPRFANRDAINNLKPDPVTLNETLELIGAAIDYDRNGEIYGEGERAEYVYKVVTGAVRVYKVLDDGRRQINGFYFSGDIVGIEAGEEHQFSAEAVAKSRLLVVKRSTLVALAARQSGIASDLWSVTARELDHVQSLMITLGRKNAQERLAAFLLEMAKRVRNMTIELPMSRQDIADYLGLTIETISRTFTQLESERAIDLPTSRRVILRNHGALARLNA